MASEEAKVADEVVVYYWPLRFRGNFIKLVLADAGVSYKTASREEVFATYKSPPSPVLMAPPMVKVGSFMVNQTPAATQYVAKKYGYEPESAENSALALKALLDCNDIIHELTRNNGHQMWDDEAWTAFVSQRLPRWLGVIDAYTKLNEGDFIFGAKICYADLALYNLIELFTLAGMGDYLKAKCPGAVALAAVVGARPGVKALVEEQAKEYGDGVCGGQIEKSIRAMVAKNIHATSE